MSNKGTGNCWLGRNAKAFCVEKYKTLFFHYKKRGYDPAVYRDLPVSSDIKEIFKFIERYQPQNVELDFKLRPFIPDYIPSIGDIDAFLKVMHNISSETVCDCSFY
jgi:hypothetical protein